MLQRHLNIIFFFGTRQNQTSVIKVKCNFVFIIQMRDIYLSVFKVDLTKMDTLSKIFFLNINKNNEIILIFLFLFTYNNMTVFCLTSNCN
jgi:hypothetical protein